MQDQTDAASVAAPRPTVTFRELGLPDPLLRAVDDLGFERCTPIQQEVLPYTLLGHDCIGKAQTGTGKTAAFLLTIMNDLLRNPPEEPRYMGEPRALVIAPTRELVVQILQDAQDTHPAPSQKGRQLKLYYGTQVRSDPPTFLLYVNDPKLGHFSYTRYLENRLRATYPFLGTPIRLVMRPRR